LSMQHPWPTRGYTGLTWRALYAADAEVQAEGGDA